MFSSDSIYMCRKQKSTEKDGRLVVGWENK